MYDEKGKVIRSNGKTGLTERKKLYAKLKPTDRIAMEMEISPMFRASETRARPSYPVGRCYENSKRNKDGSRL